MSTDPFFGIATHKSMAEGHECSRAEEYVQRGRVRNLIQQDGVYRAYVHRASCYLIKMWHDGTQARNTCSCN